MVTRARDGVVSGAAGLAETVRVAERSQGPRQALVEARVGDHHATVSFRREHVGEGSLHEGDVLAAGLHFEAKRLLEMADPKFPRSGNLVDPYVDGLETGASSGEVVLGLEVYPVVHASGNV